ncbi:MAG: hypothetical protein VX614_05225 [Myxococcota bacterium]|nr:hypothetical protein [Myxococcota bacterium]
MQGTWQRFGRVLLVCAGLAAAGLPSVPATAQISAGDAKIGLTPLALNALVGRFRWPALCARQGGESALVEEGIVFRSAPGRYEGQEAVKATFFGIEAPPGASVCFNRLEPRLSDRRGMIYLTYPSHGRRDLGVSEFRRLMERGNTRYKIIGGRLLVREIGKPEMKPREISFDEKGGTLIVRPVRTGTAGAQLIGGYITPTGRQGRLPRALTFKWVAPDGETFTTVMAEDPSRWK